MIRAVAMQLVNEPIRPHRSRTRTSSRSRTDFLDEDLAEVAKALSVALIVMAFRCPLQQRRVEFKAIWRGLPKRGGG